MRKLLIISGALIGLFLLVIGTIRATTPPPALPFPLSAMTQTVDCQLPCWHDIHPGSTTLAQVEQLMDNDPAFDLINSADDYGSHHWRLHSTLRDQNDVLITFDDQAVVSAINLTGYVNAGQVLIALGAPSGTQHVCVAVFTLIYPKATVTINFDGMYTINANQ